MEIEVSRRVVWNLGYVLLIIGPLLVGLRVSPLTDNGRPLLLSPRLARLSEYRREVHNWVGVMQKSDEDLAALLEEPLGDLLDQNRQVSRTFQETKQLVETIDGTQVPPTFETLHQLLVETSQAYLDAALLTARWIGEPGEENLEAAVSSLASARELLERLYANPWIEVQR